LTKNADAVIFFEPGTSTIDSVKHIPHYLITGTGNTSNNELISQATENQ